MNEYRNNCVSFGQLLRSYCVRLITFITVAGLSSVGCGGGTTGSGGGFVINGTLRTATSTPVPGVQVSLINASGKVLSSRALKGLKRVTNDVTDTQGQFMLELDETPTSFVLRFDDDVASSEVAILSVPATAATLIIDTLFDEDLHEVFEQNELYEDDEGNELHELLEELFEENEESDDHDDHD
ncbi:MAG: hypothetical protein PHC51_04445 [bacterium]|nr:hypothetical protein [bacterium]